jgi:hypothetical protein
VFTPAPQRPREHDMGTAAGLFLEWLRQHAPNNDQ